MSLHLLEMAESTTTSGPMEEAYIPECPGLFQQHINHTNHHLGLNFSYLFFNLKAYSLNESIASPFQFSPKLTDSPQVP